MFSKDIGIDLGTANTLVFMKGKGIVMRERPLSRWMSALIPFLAVGSQAKEMIGRTPGSIVAVRPLKDGVIADFDITATMLKHFIRKAVKASLFSKPRVVVCIPSGVTEVERRAVEDAARQAGAAEVDLIEEPMAAAIGAGLPVAEPTGSMVVDIGGGTSEVAVISLGDIVTACSVRVAGDKFDEAIISYVKKKYNLLIGERTAEEIKISIGSAYPYEDEGSVQIKGRNLVDGLPKKCDDFRLRGPGGAGRSAGDHCGRDQEHPGKNSPGAFRGYHRPRHYADRRRRAAQRLDLLVAQETGMPVHVAEAPWTA